jgi:nickel transport protein
MKQLLKVFGLICALMIVGYGTAQAHKVTIFAWVEGDRIYTESKFSGGKRVKNGTVTVLDNAGSQLLEGKTDDNGEFSFKTPEANGLTIIINAGMGHRNQWTLSAAELGAAEGDPAVTAVAAPAVDGQPEPVSPTVATGLSAAEVEAIVARQLEEKLRPLTHMVAESREKGPSVADIFGGIGYILGLVGLGAYVRYRRENRSS